MALLLIAPGVTAMMAMAHIEMMMRSGIELMARGSVAPGVLRLGRRLYQL